jgi:hypothetical protein
MPAKAPKPPTGSVAPLAAMAAELIRPPASHGSRRQNSALTARSAQQPGQRSRRCHKHHASAPGAPTAFLRGFDREAVSPSRQGRERRVPCWRERRGEWTFWQGETPRCYPWAVSTGYGVSSGLGLGKGSASNAGSSRSAAAENAAQSKRPPISALRAELASILFTTHLSGKSRCVCSNQSCAHSCHACP